MPGSAKGDRATRWDRPASRRYGLRRSADSSHSRPFACSSCRSAVPRRRELDYGSRDQRGRLEGGGFAVAQGVRTDLRLTFVGLVGRQGLTALLAGG